MTMRSVHRWVMTVCIVVLAYWALSGVLLAIIDIADPQRAWANDGGGPGALAPTSVGGIEIATAGHIDAGDVPVMSAVILRAARAIEPAAAVEMVELSRPDGQSQGAVTFGGPAHRRMVFDATNGALLDGNAAAAPPGSDAPGSLHGEIKNWHRGSVIRAGNILALFTGAALAVLSVTGAIVYVQLCRRRPSSARAGGFWSAGGAMRQWHRWISIIAAAFLLNQSISGMLLAWENLTDQIEVARDPRARQPTFQDGDIGGWLQLGFSRARAAAPDAPIIGITLLRSMGEPFVPVFFGGDHAGAAGFRLEQNRYVFGRSDAVGPGGAALDRHSLMKRIHRGDVVGSFNGRYITLAAGLCLLWLLFSGLVMFLRMQQQRRKLGRGTWFWN